MASEGEIGMEHLEEEARGQAEAVADLLGERGGR